MREKKTRILRKRGFTILELIVAVVLIGIISAIVIANYRDFERKAVLQNLAQDVALSIRLAQTYGLNVRSDAGAFEGSYGIHFADGPGTEYILFRDTNRGGGGYGYLFGGVDVNTYTVAGRYKIEEVCATRAGGVDCLNGSGSGSNITYLDLLFDRPKPDTIFTSNTGASYQSATITIQGPDGATKTIEVLSTGFISIQ